MPFDGVPELEDMPKILRDRSLWPKGFQWDYNEPTHCALGLGERLGAHTCFWRIRLGPEDSGAVFFKGTRASLYMKDVTPEIVADRIERVLPNHPPVRVAAPRKPEPPALRLHGLRALAASLALLAVQQALGVAVSAGIF